MTLRKERIPKIERGNTRSHSVENLIWKRLWAYRNAYCEMNQRMNE